MSDSKQTHGAPSWIEHCGSDHQKARTFYQKVFGWDVLEHPMEGNVIYPIIAVDGNNIGGFKPFADEEPGWLLYITVDDVDARTDIATDLGATLVMPPADIPGVGRIAVFKDPQGAKMALIKYAAPEA
ncbi:VOC family protein [Enterovibrio paralichthyis]|uniref:VOC family protein n=1 Tax=Enterovibrio paralichthyis TaxID=2853805 RepID=UPI001C4574A5|nr:VOC family protein [Enterovibrio paralichthyis]MBV7297506.1 VOC family protein [Enterovibrio paralichthyis]